jgi:hypothetical protein
MDISTLAAFRKDLYNHCFLAASDALMNVSDALLTEVSAGSFIELYRSPFFERRWPSLYEAIQDGKVDRDALRRLMAEYAPLPSEGTRLVLGVDTSGIERPDSDTARDRGYLYATSKTRSKFSIKTGWNFSALVVLPEEYSSWTYILDSLRVKSIETPADTAAEQLKVIVPLLRERPVLLGDRYYGSVNFIDKTKDIDCDKLLRMQSHNVFYQPAPPKTGRRGAPKKDGDRFKCSDPATHGPADDEYTGVDEKGKRIDVACWHRMHFKKCREVDLSVIRVTRHGAKNTKRDPRVSWFIWQGEMPCLSSIVPTYGRRYSQEHGYRFDKQSLLWEDFRCRSPEQFQVWTDLVAVTRDQLCLARPLVKAELLPWESKSRPSTPQQVRRAMSGIIIKLGTPARPSQPRGKSPGWPKGRVRKPVGHYAVVEKAASRPKTASKKAA